MVIYFVRVCKYDVLVQKEVPGGNVWHTEKL